MKRNFFLLLLFIPISAALSSTCRPSQAELDTLNTQTAVAISATQTAEAPTPTIAPTNTPTLSAQDYFDIGLKHSDNGERDEAIQAYTKAIEIDPKFASAWMNRGVQYGFLQQHEQAIEDFNVALEIEPSNPDVLANRGISYLSLGENELAISDFTRVIELDPLNAAAYYLRGLLYANNDNPDGAFADLETALILGLPPEPESEALAILEVLHTSNQENCKLGSVIPVADVEIPTFVIFFYGPSGESALITISGENAAPDDPAFALFTIVPDNGIISGSVQFEEISPPYPEKFEVWVGIEGECSVSKVVSWP